MQGRGWWCQEEDVSQYLLLHTGHFTHLRFYNAIFHTVNWLHGIDITSTNPFFMIYDGGFG